MDKPLFYTPKQSRKRRGFALIITLSVLAVVIALTAILMGYMDSVRRDASYTKALVQGNIYFADLKQMLQTQFKKNRKPLYTQLYQTTIPLTTASGKFSMLLHCYPLANGVNMNWLGYESDRAMTLQYETAQMVLEKLSTKYRLKDPNRLEEMLLEVIGKSEKGVHEVAFKRMRQKNGILSFADFQQLIERYRFEADDANVLHIPWRDYFVFLPRSKAKSIKSRQKESVIDGDYISAELLSLLFDLDINMVKESWVPSEGALKQFLSEVGEGGAYQKALFAQSFLNESGCEVSYGYGGEQFMFQFIDSKKEVKNFEFYGKQ